MKQLRKFKVQKRQHSVPQESKTGYIGNRQAEIIKNTTSLFEENLETLRAVTQEAESGN